MSLSFFKAHYQIESWEELEIYIYKQGFDYKVNLCSFLITIPYEFEDDEYITWRLEGSNQIKVDDNDLDIMCSLITRLLPVVVGEEHFIEYLPNYAETAWFVKVGVSVNYLRQMTNLKLVNCIYYAININPNNNTGIGRYNTDIRRYKNWKAKWTAWFIAEMGRDDVKNC